MRKIKILFVTIQLDAGGSERVVLDLARNLDPAKFEVYIAAFSNGVLEDDFRQVCKEIYFIDKRKGFDFFAMLRLSKIIAENKIDIVNAHHYMPLFYSFLGVRLLNRKRLVYTEHSVPEVERIIDSFHRNIFYWMLFRINAVVGVSKAITEKFYEAYPRHTEKFHKILNGVDIENFGCMNKREVVRGRFGLKENSFVVGTVANFRKNKNHICLLRAAAHLKDECPELCLLFVGTGFPGDPESSELDIIEMITSLDLEGRVVLAGYQDDIPAMLSAFDAFCLPSFSEGLPVSILEAMSARVPVVASNVAGISEVVENDETGLLFHSDDDEALSRKLCEVMNNKVLADKICTNAFNYAHEFNDIKNVFNKYTQIFIE